MSNQPAIDPNRQKAIADYLYDLVGSMLAVQANFIAWFQSIPMTQKFIVVFVFVAIIFSFIYAWYMRSRVLAMLSFDQAPAFITDLRHLPNTTLPYEYEYAGGNKVPYLPASLFSSGDGQHYTWTFWIYLNGFDPTGKSGNDWGNYRYGQYKHVLSHGSGDIKDGREHLQSPAFWLKPTENTLVANISTAKGLVEMDLPDFPMNRWVHVALVVDQNNATLFRDGGLVLTQILPAEPIHLKGKNVYLFNDGGFAGGFYNLQYTANILTPHEIALLHASGKKTLDEFMYGLEYKRIVDGHDFKMTENVSAMQRASTTTPSGQTEKEKGASSWF